MDILKEDIKSLLPSGVFLIDLREDDRRRMLNCVIDAEKPVDLNLTTSISKDIHKSGILEKSYPKGMSLSVSSVGIDAPIKEVYKFKKNINKSISVSTIKDGKVYSIKAVIIDVKDDYVEIKREGFDNEFVPIAEIVHAKLIIKFS
ncbi:MAG: hypothetical protein VX680_02930 [Candidatus Neomarinimicrobiota bacterium]|nr:hypothetical protein [Candidatus Neomarinimicrobiota bacterium]